MKKDCKAGKTVLVALLAFLAGAVTGMLAALFCSAGSGEFDLDDDDYDYDDLDVEDADKLEAADDVSDEDSEVET